MIFSKIKDEDIIKLTEIVGKSNIEESEEIRKNYGRDQTEDLCYPPDVVIKPENVSQISRVLAYCNKRIIAVTPIGGKTGLSGGALSVFGGVGLSLERLNKILDIDEKNLQATVESGVITQTFQNAVIEKGLYYPPDPSSRGSCFIGGNLAENAGGPRAVKYGVTKDFILNLEVVLPNGNVIWTGANVLKNATGYNLTQLMVGSEGTLGIITKAVFKLIPCPKFNLLLLIPFYSVQKACEAVSAIFRAGITPSALEFMERDAIDWVMKYVDGITVSVDNNVQAHLLVEVDGNDMDVLYKEADSISAVMSQFECGEILFADTADQKDTLWKMRRQVAEAVKANSIYKEEDTVVPRYKLPELIKGVKEIGVKYRFKSICYGHAGDGNLHINIIKGNLSDEEWNTDVIAGIREIFEITVGLGGTLSGEHGIGLVQKPYMNIAFQSNILELQKNIKAVFDPNGILNPGKIW